MAPRTRFVAPSWWRRARRRRRSSRRACSTDSSAWRDGPNRRRTSTTASAACGSERALETWAVLLGPAQVAERRVGAEVLLELGIRERARVERLGGGGVRGIEAAAARGGIERHPTPAGE